MVGDNLSKVLASSFFWNLTGNLFSKGALFVSSIIAARILGPEDFGKVSIIQQTIAMFLIFSVMGVSVTAIKYVAENKLDFIVLKDLIKKIYLIILFSSFLLSVFLFFLSDILSHFLVKDSSLSFILKFCSIILFINAINQVQFGILSGLSSFYSVAKSNIYGGLSSILLSYIFIVIWGLNGYILSVIVSCFIIFIFNFYFIFSHVRNMRKIESKEKNTKVYFKDLLNYSWPNLVSGIAFSISSWIVLTLVSRSLGLFEVGLYNSINQVVGILYLIPTMFAQVLMSFTASSNYSKDEILNRGFLFIALFSCISSIPVFLFPDYILSIYSSSFSSSGALLALSIPYFFMLSFYTQLNHYLLGLGKVIYSLISVLLYSSILVFLSFILIEKGVLGVVIAKSVAVFFQMCFCFYFVKLRK